MRRNDYMPQKDADFDILQTNVYNAAQANASKWLIPQELVTALDVPRQRWSAAYAAYCVTASRTPAVTREKNDAGADYRAVLRTFIQGQIMHNSRVSDGERLAMGLPVYDRKPTQARPPETRTEMEIFFPQIMKHILHVRDSESKSAGKPAHVIGFEIWRRTGGDTEPAFEEMQFVELATRSPHTLEYTSADRGKMVWYATRWVNTRGEKGPWSEILSAIVP
ncbi:MAG: hypothetical protein LBP98_00215 [Tannerella sp.]|jgi:hypothetical protein|nr:hypothetical protein [Tannerella sp.]